MIRSLRIAAFAIALLASSAGAVTVGSSITKPEDGLPIIQRAALSQLGGVPLQLSRSEFDTLVTTERNRISSNSIGILSAGDRLRIVTEVGERVFVLGTGSTDAANAAASNFRTVVIPGGKAITLGADTNTVTATNGTPTGGNSGDVAVDVAGNAYYTNASGTWSSSGTLFPVGGGASYSQITQQSSGTAIGFGTNTYDKALNFYSAGLNFVQVGNPASAPTAALGSTGVLTGTFIYCYTYYTATSETACSNNSASISPATQQVTLTLLTSPEASVVGRKVYRTTVAGTTSGATGFPNMWLAGTIANNTATTYTDNASDASIVVSQKYPLNNGTGGFLFNRYSTAATNPDMIGYVGKNNTFLGDIAGNKQATIGTSMGWENVGIGAASLNTLTDGQRNTALGNLSLNVCTNCFQNTALGYLALGLISGESFNVGVGQRAFGSSRSGNSNTAIGYYALHGAGTVVSGTTMGKTITAVADYSGTVAGTVKFTTATHNFNTGDPIRISGTKNYDGLYTVTVIDTTNIYVTGTFYSTEAVGMVAPDGTGAIDFNTALGYYAGELTGSGSNNTFLGYQAGYRNVSPGGGWNRQYAAAIGANAQVDIDSAIVIGGNGASSLPSRVVVGLGDAKPIYPLTLAGDNGAQTIGVNRNYTTATAGNSLTIRAGGAAIAGSISAFNGTVTTGGTGYRTGDVLTITTGGTGATVKVDEVAAGGVVTRVHGMLEGAGYTTGTGKATSGGTGTGAQVTITTVRTATDLAGGDLTVQSGTGVGTGGSAINFQTSKSGSTGSTDNTPTTVARFGSTGHLDFTGTAPAISTCGTSPTVVGNDNAFTVTAGTGATACTATFAVPHVTNAPVCTVTSRSGLATMSYAVSTTAVTITQSSLGGTVADVHCVGRF